MSYRTIVFIILYLLYCCTSCTSDHTNEQSLRIMSAQLKADLIEEFRSVNTLYDLKMHQHNIETLFIRLADLIIITDKFQRQTGSKWSLSKEETDSSQELAYQLHRVFDIPGAKNIISKVQDKGFKRINSYYYQINKKEKLP